MKDVKVRFGTSGYFQGRCLAVSFREGILKYIFEYMPSMPFFPVLRQSGLGLQAKTACGLGLVRVARVVTRVTPLEK